MLMAAGRQLVSALCLGWMSAEGAVTDCWQPVLSTVLLVNWMSGASVAVMPMVAERLKMYASQLPRARNIMAPGGGFPQPAGVLGDCGSGSPAAGVICCATCVLGN